MTITIAIERITRLDSRTDVWQFVQDAYGAAQQAGDLPISRPRPTRVEAVIVASREGRPVGFALFYGPPGLDDLLWLDVLYVAPNHRRAGIGRLLIADLLRVSRILNRPRVQLGTLPANSAMQALARDMGFTLAALTFEAPAG